MQMPQRAVVLHHVVGRRQAALAVHLGAHDRLHLRLGHGVPRHGARHLLQHALLLLQVIRFRGGGAAVARRRVSGEALRTGGDELLRAETCTTAAAGSTSRDTSTTAVACSAVGAAASVSHSAPTTPSCGPGTD